MNYELLSALLPYLAEYELQAGARSTVPAFAAWLSHRTAADVRDPAASDRPPAPPGRPASDTVAVGRLLVILNRYARGYARRALEGTPLGSMDEYVYLVVLRAHGAMSKTQLIHESRHEKPTGMEIIRRLIKAGYITQEEHPTDRRGRQLRLTPDGYALLGRLDGPMQAVADLLPGNLDGARQRQLLELLEQLEHFHDALVHDTKGGDFDAIVQQAGKLRQQ